VRAKGGGCLSGEACSGQSCGARGEAVVEAPLGALRRDEPLQERRLPALGRPVVPLAVDRPGGDA